MRTKARNMNKKILTTTKDVMTLQIIKRLDRKYTERQYHRKMSAEAIETNSIKGKNCQCYKKYMKNTISNALLSKRVR